MLLNPYIEGGALYTHPPAVFFALYLKNLKEALTEKF